MKRHLGLSLLVAGLLLPLTPGQDKAEQDKKPAKEEPLAQLFKRLDKNGDGKISEKEFIDGAKSLFDALDRNRDGMISLDELKHLPIRLFAVQGNTKPADGDVADAINNAGTWKYSVKVTPTPVNMVMTRQFWAKTYDKSTTMFPAADMPPTTTGTELILTGGVYKGDVEALTHATKFADLDWHYLVVWEKIVFIGGSVQSNRSDPARIYGHESAMAP
jgi:hypothetical protein